MRGYQRYNTYNVSIVDKGHKEAPFDSSELADSKGCKDIIHPDLDSAQHRRTITQKGNKITVPHSTQS